MYSSMCLCIHLSICLWFECHVSFLNSINIIQSNTYRYLPYCFQIKATGRAYLLWSWNLSYSTERANFDDRQNQFNANHLQTSCINICNSLFGFKKIAHRIQLCLQRIMHGFRNNLYITSTILTGQCKKWCISLYNKTLYLHWYCNNQYTRTQLNAVRL